MAHILYDEADILGYDNMSDEDIIDVARSGSSLALDYIINKYEYIVIRKTRAYFLIGAEREDIMQEGMIGLYKAIRDYNSNKSNSFKSFAETCVTRQILTAIKTATRKKHTPLNSYISLNKSVYIDDAEKTLMDTIEENSILDPSHVFIVREDKQTLQISMKKVLSNLETQVLIRYLEGKSYVEIAKELNKGEKIIDNALQRAKRKFKYSFEKNFVVYY